MFDFELHEDERADQDQQACCESDDDIIEIDDVSPKVVMGTGLFREYFGCLFGEYFASWLSVILSGKPSHWAGNNIYHDLYYRGSAGLIDWSCVCRLSTQRNQQIRWVIYEKERIALFRFFLIIDHHPDATPTLIYPVITCSSDLNLEIIVGACRRMQRTTLIYSFTPEIR